MKTRSGFSLLEVLVALVVFAIGVTGMLAALGEHLRNVSYLKDQAVALRLARGEMAAMRRMTYAPESESAGERGRFSWKTTAEEIDSDEIPGMDSSDESQSDATWPYDLTVNVYWSDFDGGEAAHKVRLRGIELFESE